VATQWKRKQDYVMGVAHSMDNTIIRLL